MSEWSWRNEMALKQKLITNCRIIKKLVFYGAASASSFISSLHSIKQNSINFILFSFISLIHEFIGLIWLDWPLAFGSSIINFDSNKQINPSCSSMKESKVKLMVNGWLFSLFHKSNQGKAIKQSNSIKELRSLCCCGRGPLRGHNPQTNNNWSQPWIHLFHFTLFIPQINFTFFNWCVVCFHFIKNVL